MGAGAKMGSARSGCGANVLHHMKHVDLNGDQHIADSVEQEIPSIRGEIPNENTWEGGPPCVDRNYTRIVDDQFTEASIYPQ